MCGISSGTSGILTCSIFSSAANCSCNVVKMPAITQCTAKTSHHPGSQPQHSPSCRVAIRHNGMVEQCSNARRNFSFVERYRRHLRHRRDHLDARLVQFNPSWRLGLTHNNTLNSHDTFDAEYAVLQRPQFSLALRHHLHDTPAIANNQEVHTP